MATKTTQIKVTLPNPLLEFLSSKAAKYGLTLSAYVKYLIINDIKEMDFPVFEMSEKTEEVALRAIADDELGKTKKIDNIDEFIDGL